MQRSQAAALALLVLSGALGALATPGAASAGTLRIVDPSDPSAHATIGAALAAASAGDTVLVRPGTYAEAVSVTKAVRLCSTGPGGHACAPRPDLVAIESSSTSGISILSDGVTVQGFTVRLRASGVLTGINASTATRTNVAILDNVIPAALSESGNPLGGEPGIAARLRNGVIAHNTVSGWRQGLYLAPYGSGVVVSNNTLSQNGEGVLLYHPNVRLENNTIQQSVVRAVGIGVIAGESRATGVALRENAFAGNAKNLGFRHSSGPAPDAVHVDARWNRWNLPSRSAIEATIEDAGTGSTADVGCFVEPGSARPVCPPTALFAHDRSSARQPVQFRDASVPGGRPIATWEWTYSDGTASLEQHPRHAFPGPGLYTVALRVTDQEGFAHSVERVLDLTERAPLLAPPGDRAVDEAAVMVFTLQGSDPNGDALVYSAAPLPRGATLDPRTGFFRWQPGHDQAGAYPVRFRVSDGISEAAQDAVLTVRDVARAPVVAHRYSAVAASPGQPFELRFTVTSLAQGPDALALAASAPGGWSATIEAPDLAVPGPGTQEVRVRVVPSAGQAQGLVALRATSAESGLHGEAAVPVKVPVILSFALAPGHRAGQAIAGEVLARHLDGSPAHGVGIRLEEQSALGAAGGTRVLALASDAAGRAAFTLPADPAGAGMPGSHKVSAIALAPQGEGGAWKASYTVGA